MNSRPFHAALLPRMLTTSLVVVAALAWLLATPAAQADVVEPPPDDCPAGTEGSSSHCGSYCWPQICVDSSDCTGGKTCQALALCLEQTECGSHWDPDAAPVIINKASRSCASGAACASGTCETIDVCAEDQSGEALEVDQGCGCRLDGRRADSWGRWPRGGWALWATALGLILWRRRNRH
jgi:hypothetical protein